MKVVWKVVSALSVAASSLSLLMLIKHGFDFGFIAPLNVVLDFYQQAVEFMLGWADPYLRVALDHIGDWLAINLHPYPHWKYIFVPLWLYFSADSKMEWSKRRKGLAVANILYGGLIALMASVASATVALDDPDLLPVVFPVAGLAVYGTCQSIGIATFYGYQNQTWWQTFRYYALRVVLADTVLGGLIIFVGLLLEQANFAIPNHILLIIFIIALAMRQIAVSAWVAASDRAEGQTWTHRFRGLAGQRVGFLVLQSVGGAAIFIALNAGLKFAGL